MGVLNGLNGNNFNLYIYYMRHTFLWWILCLPVLGRAQAGTSGPVKFVVGLSWEQVQAKAKAENKYIFLDCFATWCAPCKKMDRETYQNDTVAEYVNEGFVSAKVQMDTTKSDDVEVMRWYEDARRLRDRCNVNSYPTFLFFAPDGKVVGKSIGYEDAASFLALAKGIGDPENQYYTLLEKFRSGNLGFEEMKRLVFVARSLNEHKIADSAARGYLNGYIYGLSNSKIFLDSNLQFINLFMQSSKEKGFALFYNNRKMVDSILGREVAENKVMAIINNEEIRPILNEQDVEMNWRVMHRRLTKEYGELGQREVMNAQFLYYWKGHDWRRFGNYYVYYYRHIGTHNAFHINNAAWDIFAHVNKHKILKAAIKVLEAHREENESSMDTYANLLYKLGRKAEAIQWEEGAIKTNEVMSVKLHAKPNAVYKDTLEKMRTGRPTWEG